jgi:hypothetical protein
MWSGFSNAVFNPYVDARRVKRMSREVAIRLATDTANRSRCRASDSRSGVANPADRVRACALVPRGVQTSNAASDSRTVGDAVAHRSAGRTDRWEQGRQDCEVAAFPGSPLRHFPKRGSTQEELKKSGSRVQVDTTLLVLGLAAVSCATFFTLTTQRAEAVRAYRG